MTLPCMRGGGGNIIHTALNQVRQGLLLHRKRALVIACAEEILAGSTSTSP